MAGLHGSRGHRVELWRPRQGVRKDGTGGTLGSEEDRAFEVELASNMGNHVEMDKIMGKNLLSSNFACKSCEKIEANVDPIDLDSGLGLNVGQSSLISNNVLNLDDPLVNCEVG